MTTKRQRVFRGITATVLGLLLWGAEDGLAAAFTVTPVRVFLGRGTSTALLNVKNDSGEPIRFQISLQAWNQAPDGEMQLSNTSDLVFFPKLMELKPGEEKKVRIGSNIKAPVATERSYRIFFEELPPSQVMTTPQEQQAAAQVRVLTKMGVPIFIQPASTLLKADLTSFRVAPGALSFEVRNMGNSFFMVTAATIKGFSGTGAETFARTRDGWYVLAGGMRRFDFEVPAEACAGTERIRVEVSSSLTDERGEPLPLVEEVPATGLQCGSLNPSPRREP
jgi:fimbrial chaperone protein